MLPWQTLAGFLAVAGLAYCLVWPIRKMRAGRILKTVALPHPLGRFGGWFLMAAGIVMIINDLRLAIGSSRQIAMAAVAIVGGYVIEATRKSYFHVTELGILRFPSFFKWKDIEGMDWKGPTTLRVKLRRRIFDPLDPRFLRREIFLRVPASQIEAFRELLESKGVDLKSPDALFWPTRPTTTGES
jgi:hypothetical protein